MNKVNNLFLTHFMNLENSLCEIRKKNFKNTIGAKFGSPLAVKGYRKKNNKY